MSTLLAFLILQCVLYGINLKLLPMWSDEASTVVTVVEPPARIIEMVRADIHPPFYFLLAHWWNRIPIGSDPLVRLRALSVFFVVLTTVFLERCWLRNAPPSLRNWFMLFWIFSPCLLLYGRMARSYSMQVFFSSVAIFYLLRFTEDPAGWKNLAAFVAALAALLYTHYLPGIAVWAGANLWLLMSLRRGRSMWKMWLLPNAILVVLYLPWLVTLRGALGDWQHSQVYNLSGNPWTEQVLKLCYCFYSFTFGEAISMWLLPVTFLMALPCLWLFVSGARLRSDRLWPALFVAIVAYLGATRWVSLPFMGARLLFLLPLFLVALAAGITVRHRVGIALGAILFTVNLAGVATYYQARDLLNTAYMVPNQDIAREIALHSNSEDTVVWVDSLNFDGSAVEYYLPKSFHMRWMASSESVVAARSDLDSGTIRHIWFLRSSHDLSPGHAFEMLQSQMMETWAKHALYTYVPLPSSHAALQRVLALVRHSKAAQPRKYMYEMSEFHR